MVLVVHRVIEDKVAEYSDPDVEWDGEGDIVEHPEPWGEVGELPLGVRFDAPGLSG
jgi:hypothetical protein